MIRVESNNSEILKNKRSIKNETLFLCYGCGELIYKNEDYFDCEFYGVTEYWHVDCAYNNKHQIRET